MLKVPFEEDLDKIVDLVTKAAFSFPEVDSSEKPFIWITDFESHYMQISLGFSASQEGFWTTDFKVRKAVIDAFVKNKVKVAYPEGISHGEFGKFIK